MTDDSDFLGLRPVGEPGHFEFVVEPHLARHDGHLYGGTAIAVSIAAAEVVSERTLLWMTTQFVATAPPNETVHVHAEILAPGRRTNQLRVTGTDSSGETMFASLGATGHLKPDGIFGAFDTAPEVDPPEQSRVGGTPFQSMLRAAGYDFDLPDVVANTGFTTVIEYREPQVRSHPDPGPGRLCFWVRRRDGRPVTAAVAAFIADMVPMSVAQASGVVGGGISLDNTLRAVDFEETEWILVDLRPHLAAGSYGHGSVLIWSESGKLLAHGGQSCSILQFGVDDFSARKKS